MGHGIIQGPENNHQQSLLELLDFNTGGQMSVIVFGTLSL